MDNRQAKKAFDTRKVSMHEMRNKPWFTDEVKSAENEKSKVFIRYKNIRIPEEYESYQVTRNSVNQEIEDMRRIFQRNRNMISMHRGKCEMY